MENANFLNEFEFRGFKGEENRFRIWRDWLVAHELLPLKCRINNFPRKYLLGNQEKSKVCLEIENSKMSLKVE